MPTIFEIFHFKFGFLSNDHLPIHVHVAKGDNETRIILEPEIVVDWNRGFNPSEMKKIMSVVESFKDEMIDAWHNFFDK